MVFVDVTKGSLLLPACFFPFYFLRVYVYNRRIWLGNRRDVRLVSYLKDLGVWMCNDPTIGSYNDYHLSPNGIPSGR